jgi:hypothetical protein
MAHQLINWSDAHRSRGVIPFLHGSSLEQLECYALSETGVVIVAWFIGRSVGRLRGPWRLDSDE